jgi:CBS domain-containing protein
MAATVREVMNPELFALGLTDSAETALGSILALGITAAPVLDSGGHPLGVVSLRDLAAPKPGVAASERMSSPPAVVRAAASIPEAARMVAETGYRHLVVVDETRRAVGMVSAVDLIRGLLGWPAPHPVAFPHLDVKTGLQWTDDAVLDERMLDAAPDGPGLLVLVHSRPGVPDSLVWVESAWSVRNRLFDMLELPPESAELRHLLTLRPQLRFRTATTGDPVVLERVAAALRDEARHARPPQAGA